MKKVFYILALLSLLMLAGCMARTYKVTFNIYDGETKSQIIKSGDTIEDFTPTLDGYDFIGWLYDDELFDVNTPIKKNMTLYASFEAKDINITYVLISKNVVKTIKAGSLLKAPTDIEFDSDYIFLGWYSDSNFSSEYQFNKKVNSDQTIYAKLVKNAECTPTLTMSFNSTGANVNIDSMKVNRLDKFNNLPSLSRDGYTFLGWYYEDTLVSDGDVINQIEDFTLIAKWKEYEYIPMYYDITFNSNGGSNVDVMNVEYSKEVTLPSPTRTNCTFEGWYLGNELLDDKFIYNYNENIEVKAKWSSTLTNIKVNGSNLTYKSSDVLVRTPTDYCERIEEFRAVWVTSYVGDFSPSTDQYTMKKRLNEVLDRLQSYNMNAIVFHVRTTNNAFYQTKLAPINSSYGTYDSFNTWDYLEWLIDECHNRGIEFHAWLNPYRLASSGWDSLSLQDIANKWKNYPENPASDVTNILKTYSGGAILNPAKEVVQDYIVKVCKELAEKYKIDAIHFDDYFYAQLSSGSILNEADQADYVNFIQTNPSTKYKVNVLSDKQNWRRDNVTNMIRKIHDMLADFNKTNSEGRYVQFGISPTGIYKNGDGKVTYDNDGKAITSGSKTGGQEHYASYLYCDSLKWANEDLIDYLCPQTYWQFSHSVAGFADVVNWWQKAMKNNNCKLYLGIGIYFSFNSSMGSWYTDKNELVNQIQYASQFDTVKGFCIFSYKQIVAVEQEGAIQREGLLKLKNVLWKNYVSPIKFEIK